MTYCSPNSKSIFTASAHVKRFSVCRMLDVFQIRFVVHKSWAFKAGVYKGVNFVSEFVKKVPQLTPVFGKKGATRPV